MRDRTWGHKKSEHSPIFLQFLDGTHQLMRQFPMAFEFNEWWLLELHDALYSMANSDFRCNHEKGTVAEREDRTPAQVWSLLYGERADEFRNAAYDPEADERVLMPPVEARTWVGYFNRWTEDPIRGKPGSLLNAPNEHTLERPKRTFEELLMNASKPPVPALCVEKPYRHSGWLWQVSGKLKKEKQDELKKQGMGDKEIQNLAVDKRRNSDLSQLTAVGGPFTKSEQAGPLENI